VIRSILSVVAGSAAWTVLWLGWNAVVGSFFPDAYSGQSQIESLPLLWLLLAGSVLFSLAGGYVTAWAAGRREPVHVIALAVLQLVLGIFFELQSWALLPAWYHLAFLALLIPATLAGGWLRGRVTQR
jgi:hypothetical protein